jgi:HK97 family phage major capsid protein
VAKRRTSAEIAEEMEVLRAELTLLNQQDDDTDEAAEATIERAESALEEFKGLKVEYDKAIHFEKELEAVRSLSLNPTNVETGDGAKGVTRSKGPEVMRQVQPYEDYELVRGQLMPRGDMISRAKKAVDDAPEYVDDKGREHMTRLLEKPSPQTAGIARHMLMTGSPEYHEEFEEFWRTNGSFPGPLMRAALSLTNANGGYLVPFTLDPTIILTNAGAADPIRQISRNIQIVTDDWNGVTSAGVSAEWLGEATEAADASPTFGQPVITPRKAAAWVVGSYEVLADSGFASELSMLMADAKTRLEATAYAVGNTGATQPRGAVAAVAAVTAQIVTAATISAFVSGDVYRVSSALRPRDAAQASWVANKSIFNLIRQMDTAGGSAFWANMGMGTPSMLLGQPQYEASAMGSVVTTSANILLAGNFEKFAVVDRVGFSMMYEPMVKGASFRPTGQAGWFGFWRTSSDVLDVQAFKLLQLHTTAGFTALA